MFRCELQELHGRPVVNDECDAHARRWRIRCDEDFPPLKRFIQIINREGEMRHGFDEVRHLTIGVESDPLYAVRTVLEAKAKRDVFRVVMDHAAPGALAAVLLTVRGKPVSVTVRVVVDRAVEPPDRRQGLLPFDS